MAPGIFILLMFCQFSILVSFLFLERNERVFQYRSFLIDQLYDVSIMEIDADMPDGWDSRIAYFRSIEYMHMIWKFWVPINKFYDMSKFNLPQGIVAKEVK